MKKTLLLIICLFSLAAARANFTSFNLTSQSTDLTYLPTTSYTSNSLFVNFTGNSGGNTNYTTDSSTGAIATFSFTNSTSLLGANISVQWIFGSSMSSIYTTFPTFTFPGSVFLGSGAETLTLTNNTLTIQNGTTGWSGADYNGFLITNLSTNSNNVPDGASTLLLLGMSLAGISFVARRFKQVRQ